MELDMSCLIYDDVGSMTTFDSSNHTNSNYLWNVLWCIARRINQDLQQNILDQCKESFLAQSAHTIIYHVL